MSGSSWVGVWVGTRMLSSSSPFLRWATRSRNVYAPFSLSSSCVFGEIIRISAVDQRKGEKQQLLVPTICWAICWLLGYLRKVFSTSNRYSWGSTNFNSSTETILLVNGGIRTETQVFLILGQPHITMTPSSSADLLIQHHWEQDLAF